jgi:hypothetical protein
MENVKSLTLSYTFFRTGDPEVLDIAAEIRKQEAPGMRGEAGSGTAPGAGAGLAGAVPEPAAARIKAWTEEVAAKTGVRVKAGGAAGAGAGTPAPVPPAPVAAK